jgi:hypothetical protein
MPRQNSTGLNNTTVNSSTTGIKAAKTVENVTSPGTADTEFTIVIAADVVEYRIRARNGTLKIADTATESGTEFETVIPGNWHVEENLSLSGAMTLYCQLNKASTVIEIVRWT